MRKFLEKDKYNLVAIESIKRRVNEVTEQHAKVAKNRHELGIYRRNEPSTYEPLRTLRILKKEIPLNPLKKKNAGTSNSQAGAQTIIKSIVHRVLELAIWNIDDISYSPTPSTVFVDNTVET